jgi:sarcosine oxidase subunit gamma
MVESAERRTPTVAAKAWLEILPPATRLVLHGDASARARALPAWGVEFAMATCRAHVQGDRATLWLGPEEYLLLDQSPPAGAGAGDTARLIAELEAALGDAPHALVDVSHRQFALQVSGAHAATILNGACPLDLDLNEFPVGMCTRTVLAKADIVLWRTRPDAFHVEVWRSFAGYVTGLLAEIAAPYHPGDARP